MKISQVTLALLLTVGIASRVDAAIASWDPNTESDIAGYLLSYGTQPGDHTSTIDVGNVTTVPFNPEPGRRYYIVVRAYNTAGYLSEKSSEASIDIPAPAPAPAPNQAPAFIQPANQSTVRNKSVSLAMVASDPDGTALRFSSKGLPPGLLLNGTTGVIAGVVSKIGSNQVTVTVSDGALSVSRTFTWKVTNK